VGLVPLILLPLILFLLVSGVVCMGASLRWILGNPNYEHSRPIARATVPLLNSSIGLLSIYLHSLFFVPRRLKLQLMKSQLGPPNFSPSDGNLFGNHVSLEAKQADQQVLSLLSASTFLVGGFRLFRLQKHRAELLVVFLEGCKLSRINIANIYLVSGLGTSDANKGILGRVGGVLRNSSGPSLIGGDFQSDPQLWADADFFRSLGHRPVFPDRLVGTFKGFASETTIDYFSVDTRLLPAVLGIEVVLGTPLRGHRPVLLTCRMNPEAQLVLRLCKPSFFTSLSSTWPCT
jgi:hypothetical protein